MDYEKIISDRKLFNEKVYTPLSEALKILEERRNDKELIKKVEDFLEGDIPECLKREQKFAVHFRQIATPNFDSEFFLSLAEGNDLTPVFFEYFEDKFTSNNNFKHSLGQLRIHDGINKNGDYKIEKITIVDFAEEDGNKLKNVKTLWGEPLTSFHHNLFNVYSFSKENIVFYDLSSWLEKHGALASNYYKYFFSLLIKDAILFENYLTTGMEGEFSKKYVLPAIEFAHKEFGLKPLIVPIPPMEVEEDEHWISYNVKIKELIKK